MMRTVQEPGRETPVVAETDVLVVGGGPAGQAAAVAAARAGAAPRMTQRSQRTRSHSRMLTRKKNASAMADVTTMAA